MKFVVKTLNVIFCLIVLNAVLLPIEAQLLSGTSVVSGNKHYYIETVDRVNFFQGSIGCAQLGMTLASIDDGTDESKRLNAFLTSKDILANTYWLSGIKGESTADILYWLGTGKPVKNPPTSGSGNCVSTDASFALTLSACDTSLMNYICEKPLEPYCGKYGQCRYTYSYNSN